jgi:hypothetical protein
MPEPRGERRAPQPRLYSWEQLRGRQRIYLRRRSDKARFAAHLGAAAGLVGLSAWWVFPLHSFAGPVLVSLTRTHGVHVGDLATLPFLAIAGWSSISALRMLQPAPVPARR